MSTENGGGVGGALDKAKPTVSQEEYDRMLVKVNQLTKTVELQKEEIAQLKSKLMKKECGSSPSGLVTWVHGVKPFKMLTPEQIKREPEDDEEYIYYGLDYTREPSASP